MVLIYATYRTLASGSDRTRTFSSDDTNPHEIDTFLSRIMPKADRIHTLEIYLPELFEETPDDLGAGLILNNALRHLPSLEHLTINGCNVDDNDYNMLSPPPHLRSLRILESDFPPSPEFLRFLRRNPTITTFLNSGGDTTGTISSPMRLPAGILPNLTRIQADLSIVGYFVSGRPVSHVEPTFYPTPWLRYIDHNELSLAFQGLGESTAAGGIQHGGGVTIFGLGCDFPLVRLHTIMPNLEHLLLHGGELVEYDIPDSQLPDGVSDRATMLTQYYFWSAENWANGLRLFSALREISVRAEALVETEKQFQWVHRWVAASSRSRALRTITFDMRVGPERRIQSCWLPGLETHQRWRCFAI